MIRILLSLLFLLLNVKSFSQTYFYNEYGCLFSDSSLCLENSEKQVWSECEEYMISSFLVDHISYPIIALENNVKGTIIIQFTIDSSGNLSNVRAIKEIGWLLSDSVISALKAYPYFKSIAPKSDSIKHTFYLPVKFDLQQFDAKVLKKEKQLVISRSRLGSCYDDWKTSPFKSK